MNLFCVGDEHDISVLHGDELTCFAQEMCTDTLVLETNASKTCVRTSLTHKQLATSDFQTELMSRYLLVTASPKLGEMMMWRLCCSTIFNNVVMSLPTKTSYYAIIMLSALKDYIYYAQIIPA